MSHGSIREELPLVKGVKAVPTFETKRDEILMIADEMEEMIAGLPYFVHTILDSPDSFKSAGIHDRKNRSICIIIDTSYEEWLVTRKFLECIRFGLEQDETPFNPNPDDFDPVTATYGFER